MQCFMMFYSLLVGIFKLDYLDVTQKKKKKNYHGLLLSATKHPQAADVYIGDLYGRLKWLFYGISVFISMIVVTGFVLIPQSHWIHFIYAIIFSWLG